MQPRNQVCLYNNIVWDEKRALVSIMADKRRITIDALSAKLQRGCIDDVDAVSNGKEAPRLG